jgi:uncharacterized membrane protein YdfJ with MMPL/SSD domain
MLTSGGRSVLTVGQTDNGALPKDTKSRQAYDMLSEGFVGPGSNGPMLVAVSLDEVLHRRQRMVRRARNPGEPGQRVTRRT